MHNGSGGICKHRVVDVALPKALLIYFTDLGPCKENHPTLSRADNALSKGEDLTILHTKSLFSHVSVTRSANSNLNPPVYPTLMMMIWEIIMTNFEKKTILSHDQQEFYWEWDKYPTRARQVPDTAI